MYLVRVDKCEFSRDSPRSGSGSKLVNFLTGTPNFSITFCTEERDLNVYTTKKTADKKQYTFLKILSRSFELWSQLFDLTFLKENWN